MKTKLLLRLSALCLGLVWGTSAMAVATTQYCATPINSASAGVATLNYTCKSLGGGSYQMLIEGTSTYKIIGAPNINVGMNDINGTAGGSALPLAFSDADNGSLSATFTFTSTVEKPIPGAPYVATIFFFIDGVPGDVRFDLPTDMDWTSTCSSGCTLTVNPTMVSATSGTVTHNSAVLNVSGTDEEGTATSIFIVSSSTFASDKVLTATEGKITIADLTSNTDYTFDVKTQDKCGNVSNNSESVNIKTSTFIYHDFPTGHLQDANFGDPSGRILLTLSKTSSSSISIEVMPNNAGTVIDFVKAEINGVAHEIGVAGNGTSVGGQAIAVSDLAALDFTCNILWHTVGNPTAALWTTNSFAVSEANLYDNTSSVDITSMPNPSIVMYPNPVKDILNLTSDISITELTIRNLLGQTVQTIKVNSISAAINMSGLVAGHYLVTIERANGEKKVQKLIKN